MQIDSNIPEVARRQIEHIAEVCERIKPLVVIHCITYNHEAFLKEALEGFLMQKTDFPFVAVVHDDASTDGTAAVLREYAERYPDIILPIFEEENQYSKHNQSIRRIMNSAKFATGAKYVAMCEGDDYWTYEYKLQKQVDFLESHPDYSMCFHRAQIINQINKPDVYIRCETIEDREYNANELLEIWTVPTASICYKTECLFVQNIGLSRIVYGDIVVILNCAKIGNIWGMSDIMSVYRIHSTSVTNETNHRTNNTYRLIEHYKFIKENYPFIKKTTINNLISLAYYKRRHNIKDLILGFYYSPLVFTKRVINRLFNKTS